MQGAVHVQAVIVRIHGGGGCEDEDEDHQVEEEFVVDCFLLF